MNAPKTVIPMFKHNMHSAWRQLRRRPDLTVIQIGGLSIAMACASLIVLFVADEFGYDRFHEKADQIYRITRGSTTTTSAVLGPELTESLPEVRSFVRMIPTGNYWLMRHKDRSFKETRVFQTERALFNIFDFPLLSGNPDLALAAPSSMVINAAAARKYFGDADPMGQTVNADNNWDFTITGVMADLPRQSHLQADFFVSMTTETPDQPTVPDNGRTWRWNGYHTYLLLDPAASALAVQEKLPQFGRDPTDDTVTSDLKLQPISDIRLFSNLEQEPGEGGSIGYIIVMVTLGITILLVACINSMNLTTAESGTRALEVGVRKTLGANQGQLRGQFLLESVVLSILSIPSTVLLTAGFLPWFSVVTEKNLEFDVEMLGALLPWIFTIALLVGIVSGLYPSITLARYTPVGAVALRLQMRSAGGLLRRTLVTVQFFIAIASICGTLLVHEQLQYMRNEPLGFSGDQVIRINFPPNGFRDNHYENWKAHILNYSGIAGVTRPALNPEREGGSKRMRDADAQAASPIEVATFATIEDYALTMGLTSLAGGTLPDGWKQRADRYRPVMINETAVRRLGWPTPERALGRELVLFEDEDHYPKTDIRSTRWSGTFTGAPCTTLSSLWSPRSGGAWEAESQPYESPRRTFERPSPSSRPAGANMSPMRPSSSHSWMRSLISPTGRRNALQTWVSSSRSSRHLSPLWGYSVRLDFCLSDVREKLEFEKPSVLHDQKLYSCCFGNSQVQRWYPVYWHGLQLT